MCLQNPVEVKVNHDIMLKIMNEFSLPKDPKCLDGVRSLFNRRNYGRATIDSGKITVWEKVYSYSHMHIAYAWLHNLGITKFSPQL